MANDRVQAKIDLIKGKDETGEVKNSLSSFGSSLTRIGEIAAGMGLERLAEKIIDVGKSAATTAISTGMQFEQWKMGFDTMLGSAERSSKLLSEISEFAKKTPFELTDLVNSSKQLVAYGFAQEDVIETTKTLGDISAGIGAPINDLVYLYGTLRAQNVAYTKDLNQFTARGIPVLDLLAEKFGVAKDEVMDMASKSKIGFKDIEDVFRKMTGSGGTYFNMMERQSKTLSGVLSNVKDNITQVGLSILGFDMDAKSKTFGQLKEGSIFDQMTKGANALLSFLDTHKDQIVGTVQSISGNFMLIAEYIQKNVIPAAQAFIGILTRLGQQIQGAFTPVLNHLTEIYIKHKESIDKIAYILGAVLYAAISLTIEVIAKAIDIALVWVDTVLNVWEPAINSLHSAITFLGQQWDAIINGMRVTFEAIVNGVVDGVNKIIDAFNKLTGLDVGKLGRIGLGSSGLNYSSALNYTPAGSGAGHSKNISITNNNNFSSAADTNSFAKYQAWQISGR